MVEGIESQFIWVFEKTGKNSIELDRILQFSSYNFFEDANRKLIRDIRHNVIEEYMANLI